MPATQSVAREQHAMPRDELEKMIGREPTAPEQAARESAEQIIKSVSIDIDKLLQSLVLSGAASR
ncbi:hypothetical protein D3C72_454060 [compost metagenome]